MANAGVPTTTITSVKHTWRKIQGALVKFAYEHGKRDEYKFFASCPKVPDPWSGYENTWTGDLNERYGVASIPDLGYMAETSSVDTVEFTATVVHHNGRFAISNLAKFADRGMDNQIVEQLTMQSTQKLEAMTNYWADRSWGFASGVVAITDSDISGTTPTLVLKSGHGDASVTNPEYLARLFPIGSKVVLADSSDALVDGLDSFGTVTGRNESTGSITLLLDGSVTYSTNGIRIYFAHSLERTTMAGGSDLNKGLTGMKDAFTSVSLHGQSSSSYARWAAAYSDTAGGRLTVAKMQKMRSKIKNGCGLNMDTVWLSQGVERDVTKGLSAGLRFEDAMGMTFDGSFKTKGITYMSGKGTPPGEVYGAAKKAISLWEVKDHDGDKSFKDLHAYTDIAADVGRCDWVGNIVWASRQALGYLTGVTES